MPVFPRFAALAAALLCAAPCLAADVTITTAAGSSFTPANVSIQVGDSVTFENAAQGFHNVRADDDAFRCSTTCSYGGSTSGGAPSTSDWRFSLTFIHPGSIGYYCEIHGGAGIGMHGTITVAANPDVVFIANFDPAL